MSRGLERARRAARLSLSDVGRALGLHPRTVARWEVGETLPRDVHWTRVIALYAERAPAAAQALADVAGRVVPPQTNGPSIDPSSVSRVVASAADMLDVAPKRVRDVLRAAARAAAEAGVAFDAVLRAALEDTEQQQRS